MFSFLISARYSLTRQSFFDQGLIAFISSCFDFLVGMHCPRLCGCTGGEAYATLVFTALPAGAKTHLLLGRFSYMSSDRLSYAPVEGADRLFTSQFNEYLISLSDRLSVRVYDLRKRRDEVLRAALDGRQPVPLPPSDATMADWKVDPVPDELLKPGIEISGPSSIVPMLINALNPGREGIRAEGDLDDDEDSGGHQLIDTVNSALNRFRAVERTLRHTDPERGKKYSLLPGDLPFFMHRERGLHLDEPEVTIDDVAVPAAILGTALTLFHAGRAQIARGQGVYFYVPKMESAEEAAWYRDLFDASRELLGLPEGSIKAIALVESLPLVFQMEEALYALGPYATGLNAARWDLKASIIEYVMADPDSVWPDRFGVDIKTTAFIGNIFRRLVAICLKHDAVAIGGMATPLPSRDPEVNEAAGQSIRADKEWEARQGFLRGWVAHIFHMKAAADPFKEWYATGWRPTPEMRDPANYPAAIDVPEGPITVDGTRRNARMLIEYVEGWLAGRGAKGIDSLEGRPGVHPALMEDLATGRMSTAQIAQRIIHTVPDSETGQKHDFALVKGLLSEQLEDILRLRKEADVLNESMEMRYRDAVMVSMRWIKNYTELNFRSLGTYTRKDLADIAAEADAF